MKELMPRLPSAPGRLLVIAGLALAYFLSALLLISLSAITAGPVTTIWLPSGLSVGTMVLVGPWAAVGAFAGSLSVALQTGAPLPLALLVSMANVAGELACYWIVAGRRQGRFAVDELTDAPRLALGALAGGILSATASVTAYVQFGLIPAAGFSANWLTWMGSGVSSMLLVTPVVVYGFQWRPRRRMPKHRWPEVLGALALVVAAAVLWQGPWFQRGVDEPVILLLILAQLWVAYRFSPCVMALSNAVLAIAAVAALVPRVGHAPPAEAYAFILSLQLMLVGLALIGYFLSAMVLRQRRYTRELRQAQDGLVTAARDAGRAEIATNVLHNVGNVLNSVNVSAQLVVSRLQQLKANGITRAVQLLGDHRAGIADYLTVDPKGRLLPEYLSQATQALGEEQREMKRELQLLVDNIAHIKDVVATQQADKTQIIQVLVNLISNARHAMAGCDASLRWLFLRIGQEGGHLVVSVKDEGEGIPRENLARIFSHGFTTRRQGHGFGLHSSALAAGAMGGSLTAHSEGPGAGATFILRLPLEAATTA